MPAGSSANPKPRPCSRRELRDILERRWSRLTAPEARRSIERCAAARATYSRIRRHAIGLQPATIITLAATGCARSTRARARGAPHEALATADPPQPPAPGRATRAAHVAAGAAHGAHSRPLERARERRLVIA